MHTTCTSNKPVINQLSTSEVLGHIFIIQTNEKQRQELTGEEKAPAAILDTEVLRAKR